jgi:hypothetical protein
MNLKDFLQQYLKEMSDREKLIWLFAFILLLGGHPIMAIFWIIFALDLVD